jgi:hypothetical protein
MKIRMIQDPHYEAFAGFIGIDKFDKITPVNNVGKSYYAATQIFGVNTGERIHTNRFFFSDTCGFHKNPGLTVHSSDTFSLPTIEGYLLFGAALRTNGLIYNKKKCQLAKINSK